MKKLKFLQELLVKLTEMNPKLYTFIFLFLIYITCSCKFTQDEHKENNEHKECNQIISPNYKPSVPLDWGFHTKNSYYEYMWYVFQFEAVSSLDGSIKTMGGLFGPTRGSSHCGSWNTTSLVNTVTFTVLEDKFFKYSANYSLVPGTDEWYSTTPFKINIETYSITSDNYVNFVLIGNLHGITFELEFSLVHLGKLSNNNYKDNININYNNSSNNNNNITQLNNSIFWYDNNVLSGTGLHNNQWGTITKGSVLYNGVQYSVVPSLKSRIMLDHFISPVPYVKVLSSRWLWFMIQLDNNITLIYYSQCELKCTSSLMILDTNKNTTEYLNDHSLIISDLYGEWLNPYNLEMYPYGINLIVKSKNINVNIEPFVKDNTLYINDKFNQSIIYEATSSVWGVYEDQVVHGWGTLEQKRKYR